MTSRWLEYIGVEVPQASTNRGPHSVPSKSEGLPLRHLRRSSAGILSIWVSTQDLLWQFACPGAYPECQSMLGLRKAWTLRHREVLKSPCQMVEIYCEIL